MATADSALQIIARALWTPKPTTDEKSERYLASALGYPASWHVVRVVEENKSNEDVDGATDDKNAPQRLKIIDRIYAGKPSDGVDMWFHHAAAQAAAEEWVEGESTGYEHKGGHLLPRKPKFQKNDEVKVLFEGEWLPAVVQKRKEAKEGFKYWVLYPLENSTQSNVPEEDIQLRDDPAKVAEDLGLDGGWLAKPGKNGKLKFSSPDGKTFTSLNSALKHKKKLDNPSSAAAKDNKKSKQAKKPVGDQLPDDGDPPWRATGHEYIGRQALMTITVQKSATRAITIEQVGKVIGWISDTDVDKNGEPGFCNGETGKPAKLFHVVFEDDPHHAYASSLIDRQDLEEYELEKLLLPVEDEPPKKKQKT